MQVRGGLGAGERVCGRADDPVHVAAQEPDGPHAAGRGVSGRHPLQQLRQQRQRVRVRARVITRPMHYYYCILLPVVS